MRQVLQSLPKVAAKLAAYANRVFPVVFRSRNGSHDLSSIQVGLTNLDKRMDAFDEADRTRYAEITLRLDAHDEKLKDMPSMPQIFAAMDELMMKSLTHVNERLAEQARSIENLQTSMHRTDQLLESVLDRVDGIRQVA